MSFGKRIKKLKGSIDALTLRERLLLFVGALVITGALWEALLAGPLASREALVSARISASRERLDKLAEAMSLAAAGIGDGLSGQVERRQELERQLEANQDAVRVFTSDLVDPKQMRHVLEELIDRQQGLKLKSASNLAVEPLIDADGSGSGSGSGAGSTGSGNANGQGGRDSASSEPMLYRHGLRLVVEGSYLDCLSYLQAVEGLPWHIYWGGLELSTQTYPKNEITLELYTLSLDEDWIGV